MHFVSERFLIFFAVVFTGYWLLGRHRPRMIWLTLASMFFYMSWNPWLILLIGLSASVDYAAAIGLERPLSQRIRRTVLVASISTNLGLLIYFKYAGFFLASAHALGNWVGINFQHPALAVILPLGISFYTFETISYVVDVYRGKIRAERNLLNYFLFIMFFPHLIAGPVVRAGAFLPQTRRCKRWNWRRVELGVRLILLGLLKKAVLADNLAAVIDPVFANPAAYGTLATWLAALAYPLQLYGDFSGYSDMAIGMAHLFGFTLHANFNAPFAAASLAEFWRRWHISLSTWLRDYLYIPLGGSRRGTWFTCRNLIITMGLGGLWHGASWTMVLWGLYHGTLLALGRLLGDDRRRPILPRPLAIASTFLIVAAGFVLFRAQSIDDAGRMFRQMLWPTAGGLTLVPAQIAVTLICATLFALGHLSAQRGWDQTWDRRLPAPAVGVGFAMALLAILLWMPEVGGGFIYFQF